MGRTERPGPLLESLWAIAPQCRALWEVESGVLGMDTDKCFQGSMYTPWDSSALGAHQRCLLKSHHLLLCLVRLSAGLGPTYPEGPLPSDWQEWGVFRASARWAQVNIPGLCLVSFLSSSGSPNGLSWEHFPTHPFHIYPPLRDSWGTQPKADTVPEIYRCYLEPRIWTYTRAPGGGVQNFCGNSALSYSIFPSRPCWPACLTASAPPAHSSPRPRGPTALTLPTSNCA